VEINLLLLLSTPAFISVGLFKSGWITFDFLVVYIVYICSSSLRSMGIHTSEDQRVYYMKLDHSPSPVVVKPIARYILLLSFISCSFCVF